MKFIQETKLTDFEFWNQAKENAKMLTKDELNQLDEILTDLFCGTEVTDYTINDLFWFDFDFLLYLLNLDFDYLSKRNID